MASKFFIKTANFFSKVKLKLMLETGSKPGSVFWSLLGA